MGSCTDSCSKNIGNVDSSNTTGDAKMFYLQTHIPQHSMLPLTSRKKKKTDKILGQSKPAYMKSYDIGDKSKPDNG